MIPSTGDRFRLHTERVIARVLKNGKCSDFNQLLRNLPGTYPTEVMDALNNLGVSLPFGRELDGERSASQLPVTHPGDFAWRFSTPTANEVALRCIQSTKDGDTIVLLGVPEVFLRLRSFDLRRKLVLIDKDSLVVDAVSVGARVNEEIVAADLVHSSVRDYEAACVLIDPPWYLDYFRVFSWIASQISSKGALLLLPLPGVGTRLEMPLERRSLLKWLRSLSYAVEDQIPRGLVYESPFFEQNALQASGLTPVDRFWRRCDLATFTLSAKHNIEKPTVLGGTPWREFVVDSVRIRVSMNCELSTDHCDTQLIPLVAGNILASVSTKHPLRDKIRVWTSGNRVFGCEAPVALISVLEAFVLGHCAESQLSVSLGRALGPRELESVRKTVNQLKHLVRDEQHDRNSDCRAATECIELES